MPRPAAVADPSKGFIDALLHQKNTNHRGKYRAGAIVDKGIDGGSDGRVYCNEVQQEGHQCEEIKQQNFFPRTFQRWPGIWVAGCQVGDKYSRSYGPKSPHYRQIEQIPDWHGTADL